MSTKLAPVVTDGEIVTLAKRQAELFRRFTKGNYPNPSEVLDGLQLLIEGKHVIPIGDDTVDLDSSEPGNPNGLRIEEHVKGGQLKWDISQVKLHFFGAAHNSYCKIDGDALQKELLGLSPYNANMLDFLLKKKNQHLIPEEWKEKGVSFWGTIYRDHRGYHMVRVLFWAQDSWNDCYWTATRDNFSVAPALIPAS